MHNRSALLVVAFGAFTAGACAGAAPATLSALEIIAPTAVDAITQLVRDRWGSDAEVEVESSGCFEAPDRVADFVGDDEREFVYACCRGKAVE